MYSNIENAYNDNTNDLDKMAKALNKKKDNLFKSQQYEFDRVEKKWNNDIMTYDTYIKNKDNNKLINDDNFEAYNKFDDKLISDVYNKTNNYDKNDDISIDSISIDSPTIDSFIDTIKSDNSISMTSIIEKIKNKKNTENTENTEKCTEEYSKDSGDIYEHIKTCKDCKKLLLKHIFNNHNHNKKNNKIDYYEEIYNKRKSLFNYFGEIENKEIFIIIILGIFMIILLDFMMKGIKNKI